MFNLHILFLTLQLLLIETESDDGGSDLAAIVDSFLTSVVEAYGMVSELTTADKEQVSLRLAAVKEMSVKCIHEMVSILLVLIVFKSATENVVDLELLTCVLGFKSPFLSVS